MQEAIALLAPALIALGFYNHLHRNDAPIQKLISMYGGLVVSINLCVQLIMIYLLGVPQIGYTGKDFINYLLLSIIFAFILPFAINLAEQTIAIEVRKNDHKKTK